VTEQLLTRKQFMQRSAAKTVASSPSTPNGPPSKKVRLSNGTSAPGTPGTPDHEILQSALAAEEKKQQEALDKAAQYKGDTKWVLSIKDPLEGKRQESMKVRHAGFAEIDAEDESGEEEAEARPVRMQFGGGLKKNDVCMMRVAQQKCHTNWFQTAVPFEKAEDSEEDTGASSEDLDSDDPTAELIRETKREVAAQRRESRKARTSTGNDPPRRPSRPADEDMDVGGLTSLSGGRQPAGRDMSNVECHKCGRKGHMVSNCPKNSAPRGSAGRGRGRGRR
jgi:hypothetical protein